MLLFVSTEIHWKDYIEYLHSKLSEFVSNLGPLLRHLGFESTVRVANARKDKKACFFRVMEDCDYDYPVTFVDIQRLHLLKKKLRRAASDLLKSKHIANEYLTWSKEINTRGMTGIEASKTFDCLSLYRRQILAYQQSIASILHRFNDAADLVGSSNTPALHTDIGTSFEISLNFETPRHFNKQTKQCKSILPRCRTLLSRTIKKTRSWQELQSRHKKT